MVRVEKDRFGLAETEDSAPAYVERSKKDTLAYDKLHQAFWGDRKKQVLERDGWRCRQCASVLQLQIDHIVNRSVGGTHDMENLQTLCANCHHRKTLRISK